MIEAAEAVFKDSTMTNSDDVKAPKPALTRWPIADAKNVSQWPNVNNADRVTAEQKAALTEVILANPEVLDG
ncbi:MAG: hypothetical protein WDN02_10285 [Methylovirgula sp.]|uniref:hypothetical protein n=1 Tax=Methylovirgula sp. TaxID=1978224 RepID=UPI0030768668